MTTARRARIAAVVLLAGIGPLVVPGLSGVSAPPLAVQEVRGRVVVQGSAGEPVDAAQVTLTTEAGVGADATFTSASGSFLLRTAVPGTYLVRVDRIGFESWTSEPIELAEGESRAVELELPIRPVRLADLDVSVRSQCWDDPDRAPEIWIVWDEARKALEAAWLAQREELFRFNSVVFDRRLSLRSRNIVQVETFAVDDVLEAPFRSLPADRLSSEGYIQEEGETIYFYAPDASVLLSDTFLGDHCFGLRREREEGRTLVGLTFEPRDERDPPDISGVLWLDEATAELDYVEFEYENIPYRGVDEDDIGGRIDFVRVSNGAFVVRDWHIRMPVMGRDGSRYFTAGFTEYGGELRDVFGTGGEPVAWRSGGTIRGTLLSPLDGSPLADAILTLDGPGPDRVRHTGPRGGFVFHGLEPGEHQIHLYHPLGVTLDWDVDGVRVELGPGEEAEVSFLLPTAEEIRRDHCGDEPGGLVLGRVATPDDLPYSRVRVEAAWEVPDRPDDPEAPSAGWRSDRTRTDGRGRYRLCGLPIGSEVTIGVADRRDGAEPEILRLDGPVTVLEFEVDG